jgi:hypothetical protein
MKFWQTFLFQVKQKGWELLLSIYKLKELYYILKVQIW